MQSNLDSLSTPTILFTNFSNPAFVAAEHIPTYGIIKRKIKFKTYNPKFGDSFYPPSIFYLSFCLLYAYKFFEALLIYFLPSFLPSNLPSFNPSPRHPTPSHLPLLSSLIATYVFFLLTLATHTHTHQHTITFNLGSAMAASMSSRTPGRADATSSIMFL